jgi:hypothetical protein
MSGDALNERGATTPGRLEAHWKFDEDNDRVALDSSESGVPGRFNNRSVHVPGILGSAVRLDGLTDSIDFGHSRALRLVGSMTVSAWIKSTSYPVDDASIVSSLGPFPYPPLSGFQLDTTVDRGPRTIGFKLNDVCGNGMARYGATTLRLDTWYHVAGAYDAEARTMDVYLNGELDNGFLRGSVSGMQRSSRHAVHVGRRRDLKGFEFAGLIDDVRIYSVALTKGEIRAVMQGAGPGDQLAPRVTGTALDKTRAPSPMEERYATCGWASEREDARLPGAVAALGVLVAVAIVGLWPSVGPILCLVFSSFAGLLLLRVASPTLPAVNLWLFPLTSLVGGMSVVVSVRHQSAADR